jgi:hypothetical protein
MAAMKPRAIVAPVMHEGQSILRDSAPYEM